MILNKIMQYITFTKKCGHTTGIDAALLLAIIHQESGGLISHLINA